MHIDMSSVLPLITAACTFLIGWFIDSPSSKSMMQKGADILGDNIRKQISGLKDSSLTKLEANLLIATGQELVDIGNEALKKNSQYPSITTLQTTLTPLQTIVPQ